MIEALPVIVLALGMGALAFANFLGSRSTLRELRATMAQCDERVKLERLQTKRVLDSLLAVVRPDALASARQVEGMPLMDEAPVPDHSTEPQRNGRAPVPIQQLHQIHQERLRSRVERGIASLGDEEDEDLIGPIG